MLEHDEAAARYRGAVAVVRAYAQVRRNAQLERAADPFVKRRDHRRGRGHHELLSRDELVVGGGAADQRAGGVQFLPYFQKAQERAVLQTVQFGRVLFGAVVAVYEPAAHLPQPVGERGRVRHARVHADAVLELVLVRDVHQVVQAVRRLVQHACVVVSQRRGGRKGKAQLNAVQAPVFERGRQKVACVLVRVVDQRFVQRVGALCAQIAHLARRVQLHHVRQILLVFGGEQALQLAGAVGIAALVDGLDVHAQLRAGPNVELVHVAAKQLPGVARRGVPEHDARLLFAQARSAQGDQSDQNKAKYLFHTLSFPARLRL